jgi:nucleotide-binding universal stress UspA family protein
MASQEHQRPGRIVVGIDGSAASLAAVAWAARAAAELAVPLLLVHGCQASSYGLWTVTDSLRAGLLELMQPLVTDAVELAERTAPGLQPAGRVVMGGPAVNLVDAAGPDGLLVIGRRGKGAVAATLPGSTAQRLLARATCPVVLIRPPRDPGPPPRTARVVVAVGDPGAGGPALAWAFGEAGRRELPLVAVHTWNRPEWPAGPLSTRGTEVDLGDEDRELGRLLDGQRGRFPTVAARGEVLVGRSRPALEAFCAPDDLLVLGHHPQRWLGITTLGALHAILLPDVAGPIVLVPEAATARASEELADAERVPGPTGALAY